MGLLGGIGDVVGGALDSAADAIGIPEGVQDAVGVVGNVATGDFADAAQQGADLAGGLLGSGSGNGQTQLPQQTQQQPPQNQQGMGFQVGAGMNPPVGPSFGGTTGVNIGLGPMGQGQGQGQQQQPPQQGGAMAQGFGNAMMQELVQEAVQGSDAEAIFEAMASGALQQMGPIGRPTQVQTPRGTRNVSPPGYRTVYLGGDEDQNAYAVLKPLAVAFDMIDDSGPRTMRQKMDDAVREFNKYRRYIEDIAPKAGLKTSNRKSGPTR